MNDVLKIKYSLEKTRYFYKVFNLVISSPIKCEELISTEPQEVDIEITFGQVPEKLDLIVKQKKNWQLNNRQILLKIPDGIHFLIEDGCKITMSKKDYNIPENIIRLFLLGSALGTAQHQRMRLVLHASALTNGKHTLIMCGQSGVGKSTTASKLIQQGFKLITDDLAVIDFRHNIPWVMPAYPQTKLWLDATEKLNVGTNNLNLVRDDIDKYAYPLQQHFSNSPHQVTHVLVLDKGEQYTSNLVTLKPVEKLLLLKENTYRKKILNKKQLELNFKYCANLANSVSVMKLIRPEDRDSLSDVNNLIVNDYLC